MILKSWFCLATPTIIIIYDDLRPKPTRIEKRSSPHFHSVLSCLSWELSYCAHGERETCHGVMVDHWINVKVLTLPCARVNFTLPIPEEVRHTHSTFLTPKWFLLICYVMWCYVMWWCGVVSGMQAWSWSTKTAFSEAVTFHMKLLTTYERWGVFY